MKRLTVIFLCAMTLLVGCSKAPTDEVTLPPCFSTETEITVEDTVYGAILSRYADGCWKVELTEPAAVKGLIFNISGENTEVAFDGLRFTFDTSRFPVGSVVSAAVGYLDRLAASPFTVINGEEQCLASGELDGKSYTLTMNRNKIPLKLEVDDGRMTIDFTTFDVVEFIEQQS